MSIFDKFKDLFMLNSKPDPTVNEIPTDVWEVMPEELKTILIDAKRRQATISYDVNGKGGLFGSGKIYDKITVKVFDIWKINTTCYNAKNGKLTYRGFFAGPLAGGGWFFDPETGEYAGGLIS